MSKQFRCSCEEKRDKVSALPATVGWLSVYVPVGTDRRALVIAQLTISLEWPVSMAQTGGTTA